MQNIEIQYFVFYPHAFSIPFIEWKIAYLIKTNTKLFRKFTIESFFLYYNDKCICKLLYIATTFLLEYINIQYEKVCGSYKSGFN